MKLIIEDKEKIADAISEVFLKTVTEKPDCVLGLATGSSPVMTYQKIIEKAKERKVSFKKVHTFNLDEYLNNHDETQSYRYFMDHNLFYGIDIEKDNTNFPTEENYEHYDEMIGQAGGIDLQILGIGADGHIAFNEPNTPFDSKTHIAKLEEQTIKDNSRFFASEKDVPTHALTMGLSTIMKSKKIVLIATGKNKKEAVRKMFLKEDISCPASILLSHPDVTIYADEEANPNK